MSQQSRLHTISSSKWCQKTIWIEVPPELITKAKNLVAAGYNFECEELRNGVIHLDCCNKDHQLSSRIVSNGPQVIRAVLELVDEAHQFLLSHKED